MPLYPGKSVFQCMRPDGGSRITPGRYTTIISPLALPDGPGERERTPSDQGPSRPQPAFSSRKGRQMETREKNIKKKKKRRRKHEKG